MEMTEKEIRSRSVRKGKGKDSAPMAQEKKASNRIVTIPNAMSAARILIVPFFAVFYLRGNVPAAAGVLALSGLTDMLDGWVARRFDQITDLGKMLDPFADKLTQGVVALCIALRCPAIRPLLLLFILKELLMLCCALVLLKKHKRPCAAKWYGKVATVMFYVSVAAIVAMDGLALAQPHTVHLWAYGLLGATGVMMAYAAFRYFQIFLSILRDEDPEKTGEGPQEDKT